MTPAQQKQLFQQAVRSAFDKWDVIQFAKEHQWGGRQTDEKIVWFQGEVLHYFESLKPGGSNKACKSRIQRRLFD